MEKIDLPERLFRSMADSNPGLIAVLTPELEYRFLNARYKEWFGIEPGKFIGKTVSDVFGDIAFDGAKSLFEQALAGEAAVGDRYIEYPFGKPRNVRFYLTPHRSPNDEVIGIFLMVLDIEAEVQARAQLEEAMAAKSRFLAAASHDLRQPLHSMTLLTHSLRHRVDDPEAVEMLAHMRDALKSLRRMFEALLDVSKIDSGQLSEDPQVVSLRKVVQSLGKLYSKRAEIAALRFSVYCPDVHVKTDPAILDLTLSNLISNAIKFTKTGGVLVGCRRRAGKVLIEVYDTGPGISENRLSDIFLEFEHQPATARGSNDGLGLGLSLVRRYCDLMGYDLNVRSVPGRGSCFSIALPIVQTDDETLSTPETPAPAENALKGMRILVLDDEHVVAYALSRNLKDRGADALSTEDVKDAEAILTAGKWPDVAVVDYDLQQEETGDAFISRMEAAAGKRLPTLILTGSTDPDSLAALAATGRKWLIKPVDPDMLSAAIAGLTRQSDPRSAPR